MRVVRALWVTTLPPERAELDTGEVVRPVREPAELELVVVVDRPRGVTILRPVHRMDLEVVLEVWARGPGERQPLLEREMDRPRGTVRLVVVVPQPGGLTMFGASLL